MMAKLGVSRVGQLVILGVLLASTGCAYMQNRGQDFTDIFDIGFTVSRKPQFSFYVGLFSTVSIGYSNFDGTLLGMADRNYGVIDARQNAAGLILWGDEQFGYESFDPEDPESPASWGVGPIGWSSENPTPAPQVVNCPKMFHFGWVGFTANCKWAEIGDFLVGWTTVDYMGDDDAGTATEGEEARLAIQ